MRSIHNGGASANQKIFRFRLLERQFEARTDLQRHTYPTVTQPNIIFSYEEVGDL